MSRSAAADPWDEASRRATRERLRADMRRREDLGPRQRSAVDGFVHALKPDAMDRRYPERLLLDYSLGSALVPPSAVVAVGEPLAATHVTWQVSGMGIHAHTAMWGSAREAAQLWAAQRAAGAERPCVVAWLGYHPPGPWGVLTGRSALRAGTRLARHLTSWFRARESLPHGSLPPTSLPHTSRPHTAVEAHSYGALVAARALQVLHRQRPPRTLDALVLSGPVGLPRDLTEALDRDPLALGLPPERVYVALAATDLLSRAGRLLSGRRTWPGATPLEVGADAVPGLAGVVGHNTSRYRPDRGPWGLLGGGHGYRDPGTASLHQIARATTGLPLT